MAVNSTVRPAARLSEATLREMYGTMLLARRLDERAWALHRQGRIAFHISGIGQEAAQVGSAHAARRQACGQQVKAWQQNMKQRPQNQSRAHGHMACPFTR